MTTGISFKDIEDNSPRFLIYMEEIDRRLRDARVPIHARPLAAFREIAKDGMQMIICGALPTPHADRVNDWFRRRYGDRLLVDFSIGKAVVLVRGDPYVMRLPLILGKWDGIIDVTKSYDGMTKDLFADLPERDRTEMVHAFVWFLERFQKIIHLPTPVTTNIDTAILQMISRNPHYGGSRWASLQAAEKTLKEFIKRRNANPPRTHELDRLLAQAEALGLPPGYWPVLTMIQCDAGARYENGVTLDQAVLAHHGSIDLCAHVAERLTADRIDLPARVSAIGDIVISFCYAIDMNQNGGLLFRFVTADGAERRLLFSAKLCFLLRDTLRSVLASGRYPDLRAEVQSKRDFRNVPPRHPVRMFLANQPHMSPRDFAQGVHQVQSCNARGCTNSLAFDFGIAGGTSTRLIMGSAVVNYFVDYLEGGIKAGREAGLFAE